VHHLRIRLEIFSDLGCIVQGFDSSSFLIKVCTDTFLVCALILLIEFRIRIDSCKVLMSFRKSVCITCLESVIVEEILKPMRYKYGPSSRKRNPYFGFLESICCANFFARSV